MSRSPSASALTPMITRLADGYRQHGSWQWLEEDRAGWYVLLRDMFGFRGPLNFPRDERNQPRGDQAAPRQEPRPSKDERPVPKKEDRNFTREENAVAPPITIDWRVMLIDAANKVVIPSLRQRLFQYGAGSEVADHGRWRDGGLPWVHTQAAAGAVAGIHHGKSSSRAAT